MPQLCTDLSCWLHQSTSSKGHDITLYVADPAHDILLPRIHSTTLLVTLRTSSVAQLVDAFGGTEFLPARKSSSDAFRRLCAAAPVSRSWSYISVLIVGCWCTKAILQRSLMIHRQD